MTRAREKKKTTKTFRVSGYATISVVKDIEAESAEAAKDRFAELVAPGLCHQCSSAGGNDPDSVELNGWDDNIVANEVEEV